MNKSNKALIADFMGWESVDGETYRIPNLYPLYNIDDKENTGWIEDNIETAKFDTDWDWLMLVAERIIKTKIGDGVEYVEYPFLRTFGMINEETGDYMVRFNGFQLFQSETLIKATYLAIIDFIEWYFKEKGK